MKIYSLMFDNFRKISFRNILDLLIEFTYLMVIFLIPLWIAYWLPSYYIFEFNKLVVFKILTLILLLLTVIKVIFYQVSATLKASRFFKKYWLVPSIFIFGLSLSLLGSLNPALSFYGSLSRQAGLLSYLYYFLWFILLSFNLLTVHNQASFINSKKLSSNSFSRPLRNNLQHLLIILVFSATLVSLYGVLQILNIDFVVWQEAPWLTHRIFSTFGQPDFLASWLLLVWPITVYLLYRTPYFLGKFFYFLAGGIQLLALFLTNSRGGILSLIFIIFLFSIYLLYRTPWSKLRKLFIIIGFVFFVGALLGTFNYYSAGRLQNLVNFKQGSVRARLNIYQAASLAITQRPLQGYGLENAGNVFIKYYLPNWAIYGNVGQNPNRAHNLILDILLSTGAFGLILYILLYYFFFDLWRDNFRRREFEFLNLALGLGLAGYLFSLLFSFSTISSEVYLWLFFALLVVIHFSHSGEKLSLGISKIVSVKHLHQHHIGRPQLKIFLKIIFSLIIFLLISRQINFIQHSLLADYYFSASYQELNQGHYLQALVLDNEMSAERPNPVYLSSYNLLLGTRIINRLPQITNPAIKKLFYYRLQEISDSLPVSGYQNLLLKAKISLLTDNFSQAKVYLSQISTASPFWPITYLEAGKASALQKNFKAALFNYYLASSNLPAVNNIYLNSEHRHNIAQYHYFITKKIAQIYERQGNYLLARKYYKLAYRYNLSDFSLLKNIANTYYQVGDFGSTIKYIQHGRTRHPEDYHWDFALALLFKANNQQDLALTYIQQARQLAPNNIELLNFQKELIK